MRYFVYCIPLPVSLDRYKLGQLYMVAKTTMENTKSSDDGFEILKNEPYTRTLPSGAEESGIYTFKKLHLNKMVPKAVAGLIPKKGLKMEETCYNAFPHTVTSYYNPGYPDKFQMAVETFVYPADRHAKYTEDFALPDDVRGCIPEGFKEDAAGVNKKDKTQGVITKVYVNVREPIELSKKDIRKAKKEGKELPTHADIKAVAKENEVFCVVYKILKIHTQFPGQKIIENFLGGKFANIFGNTHKKLMCWWDDWKGMTIEDIHKLEGDAQRFVNDKIATQGDACSDADDEDGGDADADPDDEDEHKHEHEHEHEAHAEDGAKGGQDVVAEDDE